MTRKKTQSEFIGEMKQKNPDATVLGTYKGANEKVLVRCKACGCEWEAKPANLLGSRNHKPSGCPRCAGNEKKSTEAFKCELAEMDDSLELLSPYRRNKNRVHIRCKVCGHEWDPIPNSLLNGHGCPICSAARRGKNSRLSPEEFVDRLRSVNPSLEVIGKYEGMQRKIEVRSRECGHSWSATPINLLYESGCPECNRYGTSFMEQFLFASLKKGLKGEKVFNRDTSAIGMELDIYAPDLRFAVEPGSWNAWHSDKAGRDAKKRIRCREIGIRLITVYDMCPEGSCPFTHDCFSYPYDLRAERGHNTLKTLANELIRLAGSDEILDESQWPGIEMEAMRASRRMTAAEFIDKLGQRNPAIKMIGRFQDLDTDILVRDDRCGHVFMIAPRKALEGKGCPACRYVRSTSKTRKSRKQFVDELQIISPSITVIGDYKSTNAKIDVRCEVCGCYWSATPHNLLNGHGCPACAGRKPKGSFNYQLRLPLDV